MKVLLFGAASFVGAFLLFVVQPMMGRAVLPLTGGSPATWNACLFFFQFGLLGGYLYAHLGVRWLGPRRLVPLHLVLMAAAALLLPAGVPAGWTPPTQGSPLPWLLSLLVVSVGAPFFLLSTTAPLVQRWYADSRGDGSPDGDGEPYFLYATSNLGSLGALLAYPFLVEPLLGLDEQTRYWSLSFGLWVFLVGACGAWLLVRGRSRVGKKEEETAEIPAETPAVPATSADGSDPAGEAPTAEGAEDGGRGSFAAETDPSSPLGYRVRWVLLAFAPSSLLLGVTTHLTTDVAAAPLFWVVPLALYLLSYVIAFSRRPLLSHGRALRWQPLLVIPLMVASFWGVGIPTATEMVLHLAGFLITALVCHGELVRLRPPSRDLTDFYLWIAVGGMLGGLFNAVLAPELFDGPLEYPLILVLSLWLRPGMRVGGERWTAWARDLALPLTVGLAGVAILWAEAHVLQGVGGRALAFGLMAVTALACLAAVGRPLRLTLAVGSLLIAGWVNPVAETSTILAERSFYGVHRVVQSEDGLYHTLYHGTTIHGAQSLEPERRLEPLTYYRRGGPLDQVLARIRGSDAREGAGSAGAGTEEDGLRVGVIGLGAGAMACLGRPGERWTFYEVDPVVIRIARDPDLFTYLSECPTRSHVVRGDGRIALRQAADRRFDLLVGDAFSSDAIPVHLMTKEAIQLYLDRLAPDGVLAFHVSNRHMSLEPVLAALADELGLVARAQIEGLSEEAEERRLMGSHWVVMARETAHLRGLDGDRRWRPAVGADRTPVWTDDYSNPVGTMQWEF